MARELGAITLTRALIRLARQPMTAKPKVIIIQTWGSGVAVQPIDCSMTSSGRPRVNGMVAAFAQAKAS